jgi:adenylate cyclase
VRSARPHSAAQPPEKRIEFRVGINLGDVIIDADDIYGDGVNVAARLEALAEPGGVCISRVVRDQIRDKLPYSRSSSTTPAAVAATTSIAQPLVAPRLSIVVLPFANLSNDPDQQYFADGITEDLTTDLSRIGGMLVISRDSAFTYKDKPVSFRA